MVGGRALVYCTSWDSVSTPRHLSGRGVGWILMARRLSCVFRALLILLRRSLVFLGFYSSVGVLALNNLLEFGVFTEMLFHIVGAPVELVHYI